MREQADGSFCHIDIAKAFKVILFSNQQIEIISTTTYFVNWLSSFLISLPHDPTLSVKKNNKNF